MFEGKPGRAVARDARGVVTFTLDDAPTRNALSVAVLGELDQALAELAHDLSVRALVLAAKGSAFSSGADRTEVTDPDLVRTATALLSSILTRIDEAPFPVLCRVNGAAFGAALAIVSAADISVAVSDAVFGFPEVRFGLVAAPAAAAFVRRAGEAAGLELLLTGRRFDAAEAARLGVIAQAVAPDALDVALESSVADLLLGDRAAIAATKQVVRALAARSLRQDLAVASDPRPPG